MKKIIDLYSVTFFIELIFSTVALGTFIYYRTNEDVVGYTLILSIYLSFITSLIIGTKIIRATERNIKVKDEYTITGYIFTVIKILTTLVFIMAELYFVTTAAGGVYTINNKSLTFYLIFSALLAWNIFTLFNCIVYFFIAKMNKNIKLTEEVDNIGNEF